MNVRAGIRTVVVGSTLLALGGVLAAVAPLPAAAQEAAFGKETWLRGANCADCHGWLGTGVQEDPRSPKGANLRTTTLTAEQLTEVILCGRPGTPMPAFDARAYTDARCYGMTGAQVGNLQPPYGTQALTRRHADSLAAFILSEFAGKGPPTVAECQALLGSVTTKCAEYQR